MIAAIALLGCVSAVLADDFRVAPTTYDLGDWSINVIVRESNSGSTVHSLLALNNNALGSNLSAVWYVQDPLIECLWVSKTFAAGAAVDAVKSVKLELGMGDQDDDLWAINGINPDLGAAMPIVNYNKGFVATDALGLLLNDAGAIRDDVVELLVAIGYPAADIEFEKTSYTTDNVNQLLSTYAAVAMGMGGVAPPHNPAPGPVPPGYPAWPVAPAPRPGITLACPGGCLVETGYTRGPWGAWTAGPWRLDGPEGLPVPSTCKYTKYFCQYQEIWSYTVAANCAITYTFLGFNSRCWEYNVSCTATGGTPPCMATPTPPCDVTLTPPAAPPANTPLSPHP